jgi:hypothetical protein
MKKLLIALATTVTLVGPAVATVDSDSGAPPSPPVVRRLPKSMTGTWCYDQKLTRQNPGYEVYLRSPCADSGVIVVRVDGYVASSRRCRFDKVGSPIDREYWVWGHCVESAELDVPGRSVPMGGNGGLRFQVNNLQLRIRELPPIEDQECISIANECHLRGRARERSLDQCANTL